MESARDCGTGTTINIANLLRAERREPGSWAQAKAERSWECAGCQGFAWMVKRNSSAGHFSAHHATGCLMEGRQVDNAPGVVEPRRRPLNNDASVLVLRLDSRVTGRDGQEIHADGSDPDSGGRRGSSLDGRVHQEGHSQSHNVSSLLRHLIADEGYVQGLVDAGRVMEVPERGRVSPEDLIWSMDELDPRNRAMMGRHVIVWGKVYSANQHQRSGGWFLNQGAAGYNKGAVEISRDLADKLLSWYVNNGVESFSDFSGWYVIAYGKTRLMANGGVGITPLCSDAVALLPAARR